MTERVDQRPLLLVITTGDRDYREYLLRSIATEYRVHLFLGAEPDWERRYLTGWTVLDGLADTVEAGEMIAAATTLAEAEPVHGVLTWDEARVLQAAKVAAALGLPGGDPDMVLRCRDKLLTRQALTEAGVPQPRWAKAVTVHEALAAAESIGYPVVLKPRAMAASLGVVRVDSAAELAERFAFARDTTVPGAWRYDEVLVEQCVRGQEISVDCAVHGGVVSPMFAARKQVGYPPYFEEVGHVVDGADPLLADDELLAMVRETHAALGFTDGMTHVEVMLTGDGPKLIEVNARLGGDLIPYLGMRATGIDPGLAAAAVACGRPPRVAADRERVAAVRFWYVERDDTRIESIQLEPTDSPAVDQVVLLAQPGDVVSPPPKGTLWGRIAHVTAVAPTEAECRAALDDAGAALRVRGRPEVSVQDQREGEVMSDRCAVVVDPLGTGQEYFEAFRAAGVATVAVLAGEESLADQFFRATWHPERFEHVYTFDGDLEGLAEQLRAHQPLCLIPGAETGVEVAEALLPLVVPGTGHVPELAAARRDKWAMYHAVRDAGIPHLRQLRSTDPAEIEAWLAETGLAGDRIVLKPPKSAATDNVHIVAPGDDWRPAFRQIHGQVNLLGFRNEAVLVQEFAEGTEFLIDSYSVDGRHGMVDVCRYTKSRRGDRIGIYDLVDFLPPDDADVERLWPYVTRVLDAVGVRNGCAHTEVIITANGPRLLEVGARPAGGGHQMLTRLATGTNHIQRTIDHRVHGTFTEHYRLTQYVCSVVINGHVDGMWTNAELFDDVESLSTFYAKHFDYGTGERVPAATGLHDFLGWVVLASQDRDAMYADYRTLKELERRIVIDPVQLVPSQRT